MSTTFVAVVSVVVVVVAFITAIDTIIRIYIQAAVFCYSK